MTHTDGFINELKQLMREQHECRRGTQPNLFHGSRMDGCVIIPSLIRAFHSEKKNTMKLNYYTNDDSQKSGHTRSSIKPDRKSSSICYYPRQQAALRLNARRINVSFTSTMGKRSILITLPPSFCDV